MFCNMSWHTFTIKVTRLLIIPSYSLKFKLFRKLKIMSMPHFKLYINETNFLTIKRIFSAPIFR